jgi:hypothetical protein
MHLGRELEILEAQRRLEALGVREGQRRQQAQPGLGDQYTLPSSRQETQRSPVENHDFLSLACDLQRNDCQGCARLSK